MEESGTTPQGGPPPLPENWSTMTGDEKFEYYTSGWASAEGKQFASPEAAQKYEKHAQRFLNAVKLKESDEVPVYFFHDGFIHKHNGLKASDYFYETDKYLDAAKNMHVDFDLDYSALSMIMSGQAMDTLDVKLMKWPGSKLEARRLPDNVNFQYAEGEFMHASEYEELINNPEGFILRKFIPRTCTKLAGLAAVPNLFNVVESACITGTLLGLGQGSPARQALETLLKAADESTEVMLKFIGANMDIAGTYGAPAITGGAAFTPYDMIGDTMRCTMGMMKDLIRHPDLVKRACEALVPMSVQMAVQQAEVTRNPFMFIPLHKGADGFMSNKQFKEIYWPAVKQSFLGMIENGVIPFAFVEGAYNQRLDIMAEDPLPAGKSIWLFDRTDMKAVKEKIGPWACFGGNVPASLFKQASAQDMTNYCKDLIETCAPGGGFFVAPGAVIDDAEVENVQAFLKCGRKK